MLEKRRFHRIVPTGLIPKTGVIFANLKNASALCTIVDISAGGACIEVSGDDVIPKRFTLYHAGTRKRCYVVWQKGRRVGVSF